MLYVRIRIHVKVEGRRRGRDSAKVEPGFYECEECKDRFKASFLSGPLHEICPSCMADYIFKMYLEMHNGSNKSP
jgi:hypothetical protein